MAQNTTREPQNQLFAGFWAFIEIMKLIWKEFKHQGGTDSHLKRIETDKDFRRKWVEMLVKEEVSQTIETPPTFTLTLDYSRTLQEMIGAGKYDWVNEDITPQNFPITGSGRQEVRLELLHFNQGISTRDVLVEIKRRDLEPAKLEHLLILGERHPDLQRQFPIIALDSVWQNRGSVDVPCLGGVGDGRGLCLAWHDYGWGPQCRFLVFRKS